LLGEPRQLLEDLVEVLAVHLELWAYSLHLVLMVEELVMVTLGELGMYSARTIVTILMGQEGARAELDPLMKALGALVLILVLYLELQLARADGSLGGKGPQMAKGKGLTQADLMILELL
jgi:hypothetical protein